MKFALIGDISLRRTLMDHVIPNHAVSYAYAGHSMMAMGLDHEELELEGQQIILNSPFRPHWSKEMHKYMFEELSGIIYFPEIASRQDDEIEFIKTYLQQIESYLDAPIPLLIASSDLSQPYHGKDLIENNTYLSVKTHQIQNTAELTADEAHSIIFSMLENLS